MAHPGYKDCRCTDADCWMGCYRQPDGLLQTAGWAATDCWMGCYRLLDGLLQTTGCTSSFPEMLSEKPGTSLRDENTIGLVRRAICALTKILKYSWTPSLNLAWPYFYLNPHDFPFFSFYFFLSFFFWSSYSCVLCLPHLEEIFKPHLGTYHG